MTPPIKNGAGNTAPNPNATQETEEAKALRLEREQFEAEKAEFEANKTADNEAKTKADQEAEDFKKEKEDFEAEKVQLETDKDTFKADQTQAEENAKKIEEAEMEKRQQIRDYQDKVKSGNREVEHIDFNKTGITYFGDRSEVVWKPTAKAPTHRLVNGEKVEVPKKK